MIGKKKVLCVIPARKGSKGFKDKNIKKLNNKSLIDWAVHCALGSKYIDKIILSTDYDLSQLSKLSSRFYHKRSKKLSGDNSLSYDVIKDILKKFIKVNAYYDIVVLLEPPAPFRSSKLVDKCLELVYHNKANSLVTLKKLEDYHPVRVKKFISKNIINDFIIKEPKKGLPRQEQIDAYIRDTSVYIFESSNFLDGRDSLYGKKQLGYINKNKYSVNIDSEIEYLLAKLILKNKLANKNDMPKI